MGRHAGENNRTQKRMTFFAKCVILFFKWYTSNEKGEKQQMKKVVLILLSALVAAGLIATSVLVAGKHHKIETDRIKTADIVFYGILPDDTGNTEYTYIELEGLSPSERLSEVDKWAWNAKGGSGPLNVDEDWNIEITYHLKDGKTLVRRYSGKEDAPAGKKYFATLYLKAQELYMAEKDKQVNDDFGCEEEYDVSSWYDDSEAWNS